MSPLERAARALCLIDDVDPDSNLSGDKQNFLWMEYAEVRVKPLLRTLRYLTEDDISSALKDSWVSLPLTTHAEVLEAVQRVIDVLCGEDGA